VIHVRESLCATVPLSKHRGFDAFPISSMSSRQQCV
jgi:hypothetical protein